MKNKYLSKYEINKLKMDLMSDIKSNKTSKSPKSITSVFYQMKKKSDKYLKKIFVIF